MYFNMFYTRSYANIESFRGSEQKHAAMPKLKTVEVYSTTVTYLIKKTVTCYSKELVHESLVLIALLSHESSCEHLLMHRLTRGLVARLSSICLSNAQVTIHGLDAGLAMNTIRHHSWQSVLVRSFP